MILHGYYRSSTSYRVRIALNLKGLEYSRAPVNLRTGEQKQDAYLEINPHGTVPTLQTENETLFQSLAIIDWLDSKFPTPSFLPQDSGSKQICRELYYAVSTEIHGVNNLPVLNYLRSKFGADQAVLEAWYAQWITQTFAPIEERLSKFDWHSKTLPFVDPGLFEIVLIPQIYNARRWNTDLSAFPNLCAIDKACSDIEAFRYAHPDNQSDA